MTRTLIGLDYEGVPSLKITKGDLDPVTTPDSTLGAFLFNSKDTLQTRINKISIETGAQGFTPAGSSVPNFDKYVGLVNGSLNTFYRRSFFPNLDYQMPLTDIVAKSGGYNLYGLASLDKYGYGDRTEYNRLVFSRGAITGSVGDAGWKKNVNVSVRADGNSNLYDYLLALNGRTSSGFDDFGNTLYDVVVWNLPGDNTPLQSNVPVPGMRSIVIDSSGLRIAKPGYDVYSATDAQLVMGPNKRALKVVAAEDIAIPVGASEHTLSYTPPPDSVCDIQFYTGDEIVVPGLPRQGQVGASWRLVGNKIQFSNSNSGCRARFIVIANDQVSQTTGDNEVWRQFTENGENVVQFLKPGASAQPSFSDIIIDSRWPSLRILKEGYFAVGNGPQVTSIPIDTTGYFPFVKFNVVCQPGPGKSGYELTVRPPTVGLYRVISQYGGSQDWTESGNTTYARILSDRVNFHTFAGRPKFHYWLNQADYQSSRPTYVWPDTVIGIRYYIFGIPKKDTL